MIKNVFVVFRRREIAEQERRERERVRLLREREERENLLRERQRLEMERQKLERERLERERLERERIRIEQVHRTQRNSPACKSKQSNLKGSLSLGKKYFSFQKLMIISNICTPAFQGCGRKKRAAYLQRDMSVSEN